MSKEVYCNYNVSHTGFGGSVSSRRAIFRNFLEKKASLIPLDHILHVSEPIESTGFLIFESQLKKIKLFSPPFACDLIPKHV